MSGTYYVGDIHNLGGKGGSGVLWKFKAVSYWGQMSGKDLNFVLGFDLFLSKN